MKQSQTPEEAKAYYKEYYQRPDIKAHRKAYYKSRNQKPEIKEYHKAYNKAYNQTPKAIARRKAHYKSPEGQTYSKKWYAKRKIKYIQNRRAGLTALGNKKRTQKGFDLTTIQLDTGVSLYKWKQQYRNKSIAYKDLPDLAKKYIKEYPLHIWVKQTGKSLEEWGVIYNVSREAIRKRLSLYNTCEPNEIVKVKEQQRTLIHMKKQQEAEQQQLEYYRLKILKQIEIKKIKKEKELNRKTYIKNISSKLKDQVMQDICISDVRTMNILEKLGIKTVDDLVVYNKSTLLAQPNSGKKTMQVIENALDSIGLKLNE
tara:strand:+ start:1020 stop:1961 length:942 start_codon:yes stop_codon:yes gene_type:complete